MFYLDSNNNYHLIKSCPIVHLADLQLCFERLAQIEDINSQTGASLLGHISRLSGVAIELIADDIEGVLSAIAQVNFKVASSPRIASEGNPQDRTRSPNKEQIVSEEVAPSVSKGDEITLQDYQYQLVTSLVNAELAVDLESALKIAKNLPYKDLEGYLKARVNFLNRDKIDNEKAGKELMKELADGSFFGSTKDGRDGFQEGVMKAMGINQPVSISIDKNNGDDEIPESVKKALDLD